MKKIIAFHDHNLCLRGTTANMYNMAKYNEEILGNKSIIVSFRGGNMDSFDKFNDRFETHLMDWWEYDDFMKKNNVDYLYLTKAGGEDGYCLNDTKTIIHVVFRHNEPHGYKYVYISDWLAKDQGHYDEESSLPYIVTKLPESAYDMREKLGIPKDKIVFGCYAGQTEFNIGFVHDAIKRIVQERDDIYFIFMNINKFSEDHPRIIYLPGTWDMNVKASFVRACDAMIHARSGGETFGLAVAEFAIENKPVITYYHSGESCHIDLLGERGIYYKSYDDVYDILNNLKKYIKYDDYYRSYDSCSPERVMEKFNKLINSDENAVVTGKVEKEKKFNDKINLLVYNTNSGGNKILVEEELSIGKNCYEYLNDVDIKLFKNNEILLDNGSLVKTDEQGKIKEIIQNSIIGEQNNLLEVRLVGRQNENNFVRDNSKLTETNISVESIMSVIKPMFDSIEDKIKSLVGSNQLSTPSIVEKGRLNILVSAICFINRDKKGAEIYATFANRLLTDVMKKTPYDFRIITNEPSHFEENKRIWGERVIVTEDKLEGERLTVGPFNQLLKYKTLLNVDKKYQWLLYLDCDAGFTSELDANSIENQIKIWENQGYDFLAARTNAVLRNELIDHEKKKNNFMSQNPGQKFNPWVHGGNLFSAKFIFYDIDLHKGPVEWGDPSKWMDSKLPSEHVWLIKNDEKLEKCGRIFKSLNEKFETQTHDNLITWDMEAFEVGVSAKLAGYNMGDLGNDGEFHILKIGFNFNNWEKVKY